MIFCELDAVTDIAAPFGVAYSLYVLAPSRGMAR